MVKEAAITAERERLKRDRQVVETEPFLISCCLLGVIDTQQKVAKKSWDQDCMPCTLFNNSICFTAAVVCVCERKLNREQSEELK